VNRARPRSCTNFDVVPNNALGPRPARKPSAFTSAIWFSRVDMMTDDNWFPRPPGGLETWVAPVLYLLNARPRPSAPW